MTLNMFQIKKVSAKTAQINYFFLQLKSNLFDVAFNRLFVQKFAINFHSLFAFHHPRKKTFVAFICTKIRNQFFFASCTMCKRTRRQCC
jgi:hypothetical protein